MIIYGTEPWKHESYLFDMIKDHWLQSFLKNKKF